MFTCYTCHILKTRIGKRGIYVLSTVEINSIIHFNDPKQSFKRFLMDFNGLSP